MNCDVFGSNLFNISNWTKSMRGVVKDKTSNIRITFENFLKTKGLGNSMHEVTDFTSTVCDVYAPVISTSYIVSSPTVILVKGVNSF